MKNNMEVEVSFNLEKENDVDSSVLSLYDLLLQKEFNLAMREGDYEKVDELLYSVGVDVEKGYQVVDRLHRPLSTKQVVNGSVVIYTERTDKEWIRGGAASMDAVIASVKDPSVRAEMRSMQDAYMTTGKFLDFLNK